MSEDLIEEARGRVIALMDLANNQVLQEALTISPETDHVIANDIPAIFGRKWHKKFHNVRESLAHEYQAQTGNMIKLTAHYYEYSKLFGAAQIRLVVEHESDKTHSASSMFRLATPDGYEEYEGWSNVATEHIYSIDKPQVLAEKYGFSEYPKNEDLMSAQGLIWFFKAAELQQAGRQEAHDVLFEAAEMCSDACGCFMWLEGEKNAKQEAKELNPAALLARRRHAENYALTEEVIKLWKQNIDPSLSAQKAANELIRYVPLSHKKIAEIVAAQKKKKR